MNDWKRGDKAIHKDDPNDIVEFVGYDSNPNMVWVFGDIGYGLIRKFSVYVRDLTPLVVAPPTPPEPTASITEARDD